MKHLKVFETKNAFDTEKENLESPCVALTEDDTNVHIVVYTTINEDDLTKGDFIDLGLPSGLKWASCNLGATTPCEYGDYYMWGSTTINNADVCDWEYTPYHQGSDDSTGWTKYHPSVDNKTVLDPEDDAAYVAIGGKAHIPTEEQFQELKANTTSEWVNCTYLGSDHTDHNVMGKKFNGPNGNSIFIPAAGGRYRSSFNEQGSYCYVWSSSLDSDYPDCGCNLTFSSGSYSISSYRRYCGFTVRPVSE